MKFSPLARGFVAAGLLCFGCGSEDSESGSVFEPLFGPIDFDVNDAPPALLSGYQLLRANTDGTLLYNEDVRRYTLNTPLFSDYALKDRAIYVPPGEQITYVESDVFDFPVGSVVVKTFSFPEDLREPGENVRVIETRVMVRNSNGWESYPYIWREDLSDADYSPAGAVTEVSFIDREGQSQTTPYLVPQRNQCRTCHQIEVETGPQTMTLIGPETQHLNGPLDGVDGEPSQLEVWRDAGVLVGLPDNLDSLPEVAAFRDEDVERLSTMTESELADAARGYLDVNCAHCHNDRAVNGVSSQLFLDTRTTDEFNLGVCKRPGSAGKGTGGRDFGIVPGDADASILIFRVETDDLGAIMPAIGRSLPHREGIELLKAWINAMPERSCE